MYTLTSAIIFGCTVALMIAGVYRNTILSVVHENKEEFKAFYKNEIGETQYRNPRLFDKLYEKTVALAEDRRKLIIRTLILGVIVALGLGAYSIGLYYTHYSYEDIIRASAIIMLMGTVFIPFVYLSVWDSVYHKVPITMYTSLSVDVGIIFIICGIGQLVPWYVPVIMIIWAISIYALAILSAESGVQLFNYDMALLLTTPLLLSFTPYEFMVTSQGALAPYIGYGVSAVVVLLTSLFYYYGQRKRALTQNCKPTYDITFIIMVGLVTYWVTLLVCAFF